MRAHHSSASRGLSTRLTDGWTSPIFSITVHVASIRNYIKLRLKPKYGIYTGVSRLGLALHSKQIFSFLNACLSTVYREGNRLSYS